MAVRKYPRLSLDPGNMPLSTSNPMSTKSVLAETPTQKIIRKHFSKSKERALLSSSPTAAQPPHDYPSSFNSGNATRLVSSEVSAADNGFFPRQLTLIKHQRYSNPENQQKDVTNWSTPTDTAVSQNEGMTMHLPQSEIHRKSLNDMNDKLIHSENQGWSNLKANHANTNSEEEDLNILEKNRLSTLPENLLTESNYRSLSDQTSGVPQPIFAPHQGKCKQSLPSTGCQQIILSTEPDSSSSDPLKLYELLAWRADDQPQSYPCAMNQGEQNTESKSKSVQNIIKNQEISKEVYQEQQQQDQLPSWDYCHQEQCEQEITELKQALNEMNQYQIELSNRCSSVQNSNQALWANLRDLSEKFHQIQDSKDSQMQLCSNKENSNSQSDRLNQGKTIQNLMKKNKELKQRNAEVEAVLKEILLQNEISKQRQKKHNNVKDNYINKIRLNDCDNHNPQIPSQQCKENRSVSSQQIPNFVFPAFDPSQQQISIGVQKKDMLRYSYESNQQFDNPRYPNRMHANNEYNYFTLNDNKRNTP